MRYGIRRPRSGALTGLAGLAAWEPVSRRPLARLLALALAVPASLGSRLPRGVRAGRWPPLSALALAALASPVSPGSSLRSVLTGLAALAAFAPTEASPAPAEVAPAAAPPVPAQVQEVPAEDAFGRFGPPVR